MVTLRPLACRSFANDEAMMPFPREDATPPVMKMYFVFIYAGIAVMESFNGTQK